MKRLLTGILLLTLTVGFAGFAHADTYKIADKANTYVASINVLNVDRSVYATPFKVENMTTPETFYAFCIEPAQTTTIGQIKEYAVVSAESYFTATQFSFINKLFSAAHAVIGDVNYQNAMQLILWEVVMDDAAQSLNFASGNFIWKNPAGLVNQYVNELVAMVNAEQYDPLDTYTFSILTNATTQNLMTFEYTPTQTPVPAAIWLMGSGLAGLVALRRKNR